MTGGMFVPELCPQPFEGPADADGLVDRQLLLDREV